MIVRLHPEAANPYSVIFRIKIDTIEIIAIAHAKRRPGYWRRREKKSV